MRKLLHTLAIAALASALPLVALADTNLNLDTGATGSSGGDISWNSSTGISPVSAAALSNLTSAVSAGFSTFSELILAALPYSTSPISGGSLVVNEVFAVHTNGGNYAKLLVTAVSGSSITLQYVTYNTSGATIQGASATLGGQSGPAAPSITIVQNNSSFILPNAPNYGIAPGSLILIQGTGLTTPGSPLLPLQDPTKALPSTLHGSTVSVTVGSTTVNPVFYYACDGHVCNPTTQLDLLAVVLPPSTPVGAATVTVSYGGQHSQPAPIQVVAHAFGFDSYGGALGVATDNADGHLITTSRSAHPGEVIVFWGTGDGADPNHDDVNPPLPPFSSIPNAITALYFGGVQIPIAYQGRSAQFQGVDQVAVVVPADAPTGCAVSVVAVSGTGSSAIISNTVTLPIAAADGQCTDPLSYLDPTQAATLSGKTTVKFGDVIVVHDTSPSGTNDDAAAIFYSISGSLVGGYSSSKQPSLGSCFVTQSASQSATNPFNLVGLDAGSLSVTGPNGTQALTGIPTFPGTYAAQLPAGFIPAAGGAFTFTGTGGAGVGAFSAGLNFPNPLVWTNASSDATVSRAQGVTVTWTGGSPGTYAQITGNSVSAATGFYASFVCNAPVSALTFTVPQAVLLALPAGSGSLAVSNYTNPQNFTTAAPTLDFAFSSAYASTSINATYN